MQAMNDPDTINRYLAYQSIQDLEKAKIVEACIMGCEDLVSVDQRMVDLYGAVLNDENLKVSDRSERALRNTRAMNLAKWLQTLWLHPLLN